MNPFGSVEFSIEELPAELRIRYARRAGWIERILAPAAVPVLMMVGWFWQKPSLIVLSGGLFAILIVRWAWSHQSVLRIMPDRLVTSVYLWNSSETSLADIETMQWLRGDVWSENGEPDGLYVSCAGRSKCVLPLICREQAKAATDAISRRFPAYPINVSIPGSLLFETPPDMTAFMLPSTAELDPDKKA
jgi:hypothetical protein